MTEDRFSTPRDKTIAGVEKTSGLQALNSGSASFTQMPKHNYERPNSPNPCPAWDFTFPTHHSCLKQIGLLSMGDPLAQVVSILFTMALSKSDQAASLSMLVFYFYSFHLMPHNSFPAAMNYIIWRELS